MNDSKFCSQCGTRINADGRFCDECGTAVAVEKIAPLTSPIPPSPPNPTGIPMRSMPIAVPPQPTLISIPTPRVPMGVSIPSNPMATSTPQNPTLSPAASFPGRNNQAIGHQPLGSEQNMNYQSTADPTRVVQSPQNNNPTDSAGKNIFFVIIAVVVIAIVAVWIKTSNAPPPKAAPAAQAVVPNNAQPNQAVPKPPAKPVRDYYIGQWKIASFTAFRAGKMINHEDAARMKPLVLTITPQTVGSELLGKLIADGKVYHEYKFVMRQSQDGYDVSALFYEKAGSPPAGRKAKVEHFMDKSELAITIFYENDVTNVYKFIKM